MADKREHETAAVRKDDLLRLATTAEQYLHLIKGRTLSTIERAALADLDAAIMRVKVLLKDR